MASTALIIGASRGLGLGLAAEYLQRGWNVIGTVRDGTGRTGLHDLLDSAKARLEIETLDMNDEAQVDALNARLEGRPLDLLFVNAGIALASETPIGEVAESDFTQIMRTNAFAPLRIVDRMVDRVTADGTVAVMSSELGSIVGSGGGYEIYRMSKAALNMGLKSLAVRRVDTRTYLCVSPGWVRTDMGGPQAALDVSQSVQRIADLIAQRAGTGGTAFVSYDGRVVAW
jgi:NAD(P)-dependent dehydrogenase (short-subunit alcohol dehydrogenase family)